MKHWTTITRDDGDFLLNCSCSWSGHASDWDDAVDQGRQHKSMEDL